MRRVGTAGDVRAFVLLVVALLGDPRVPRAAKGAVVTAGILAVSAGVLPVTIGRAVRTVRVPAVVLAGPTCDSADVLYEQTPVSMPMDVREGDVVLLHSAGASSHAS